MEHKIKDMVDEANQKHQIVISVSVSENVDATYYNEKTL